MKRKLFAFFILIFSGVKAYLQDVIFPRQLTNAGSTLVMYQPQVDTWEKYKKLAFRVAFSLKPSQGEEILGVMYMEADTETDMDTHRVLMDSISVLKISFSLPVMVRNPSLSIEP